MINRKIIRAITTEQINIILGVYKVRNSMETDNVIKNRCLNHKIVRNKLIKNGIKKLFELDHVLFKR